MLSTFNLFYVTLVVTILTLVISWYICSETHFCQMNNTNVIEISAGLTLSLINAYFAYMLINVCGSFDV